MKTKSRKGTDEALSSAVLQLSELRERRYLVAEGIVGPLDPDRVEEDQDTDDFPGGVDEDELDEDDLDTDRVTDPEAIVATVRVRSRLLGAHQAR